MASWLQGWRRLSLAMLMGLWGGCAETPPAPPPPTLPVQPAPLPAVPFFSSDPNEAKAFRTLARDQESHLGTCAHERTCDQAHFSRALLALFENQRLAAKHFQDVMTIAPKGRLAAASADWLKLLQDSPPESERQGHFAKVAQALVVELLNREQAVKEELNVREKRVEELSTQLETLKLIDQEMNEKTSRMRPRSRGLHSPPEMIETSK